MRSNTAALVAAASLSVALSPAAAADDETAEDCVQLNWIQRTEVVSDYSIVFYMRDGRIFLNSMPRRCPQLGHEKRFMYSVPQNRLCRSDTITVLSNFGFGLEPAASCVLSAFTPISKAAAEALKAEGEDARPGARVTSRITDKGTPHKDAEPPDDGAKDTAKNGAADATGAANAESTDGAAKSAEDSGSRKHRRHRRREDR